jgi:hypothetical protein
LRRTAVLLVHPARQRDLALLEDDLDHVVEAGGLDQLRAGVFHSHVSVGSIE